MLELKLVFWDWLDTLFTKDLYTLLYLHDALNQNDLSEKVELDDLNTEQIEEFKLLFMKYKGKKVFYNWVLVEKFLSLNIHQVIVSNGTMRSIKNELNDIDPFDLILTSEDFISKPDTAMFEFAANKLNILDKNSMIMIGDSVDDQSAAEKFGIKFYKIEDYFLSALKITKDFNLFG